MEVLIHVARNCSVGYAGDVRSTPRASPVISGQIAFDDDYLTFGSTEGELFSCLVRGVLIAFSCPGVARELNGQYSATGVRLH